MAASGENEQALRKILDLTRFISMTLLVLHFYFYCYGAFQEWKLTLVFTDRIMSNLGATGLFHDFHRSKWFALLFLLVSLVGTKGKKGEKHSYRTGLAYLIAGVFGYFISALWLWWQQPVTLVAGLYIGTCFLGYLFILMGGTLITRVLKSTFNNKDIFNKEAETFPQETRLLVNENSINIPMRFRHKNKWHKGWLNNLAPYRSTLITGSAGAGKTAYLVRQYIQQALAKDDPYTLLVYDFKFPDLSVIAYNHWLKNKHKYKAKSECYFINFDDPKRSHRGNPLEPEAMQDITDATEASRTILLGLNKQWQTKQGDFFVESAINFFTAVIWFLRMYKDGIYCTLPHCIEFLSLDYNSLFTLLSLEPTITTLVSAYINAYKNDVMEQLEGQIASAKVALGRLSSPQLYYVLTGKDFTLDINNPDAPKILCIGNSPQKTQIYGAVLSLFANRLLKVINKKDKLKSMLIMDEYPTIYVDFIPTISTGRSNRISVVLVAQSINQLRKEYGKEAADVIVSIAGNLFAGQETGDNAKQVSEQIGKIMQERESLSINDSGTSISKSKQLDYAVPPSKIATLSSGQFVGILSDIPQQPMELKAFDCEVMADFDAIGKEEASYKPIPIVREVTKDMIQRNYDQVKQDVQDITRTEIERLLNDPTKMHLVIRK